MKTSLQRKGLVLALFTMMTLPLAAQVKISTSVVANGATSATGGTITMRATVGQPVIGVVTNGNDNVSQGFWSSLQPLSLGVRTGGEAVNHASWKLQSYPNPMQSDGTIRLNMTTGGEVDIILYNAVGQEVATLFSGSHESGSLTVPLNVEGLASGTYNVVAITETGLNALSIIVQH